MSAASRAYYEKLYSAPYHQYGDFQVTRDWKWSSIPGNPYENIVYNPKDLTQKFLASSSLTGGELGLYISQGDAKKDFGSDNAITTNLMSLNDLAVQKASQSGYKGDLNQIKAVIAPDMGPNPSTYDTTSPKVQKEQKYVLNGKMYTTTGSIPVGGTLVDDNGNPLDSGISKGSSGSSQAVVPTQEQLSFSGNLKLNTGSSEDIKKLQNFLNTTQNAGLTADGKFGPLTEAAVKKFQNSNGLTPDGIVGPKTVEVINKSNPQNQAQNQNTQQTTSQNTQQTTQQNKSSNINQNKDYHSKYNTPGVIYQTNYIDPNISGSNVAVEYWTYNNNGEKKSITGSFGTSIKEITTALGIPWNGYNPDSSTNTIPNPIGNITKVDVKDLYGDAYNPQTGQVNKTTTDMSSDVKGDYSNVASEKAFQQNQGQNSSSSPFSLTSGNLKSGSTNSEDIKKLQEFLGVAVDGKFGPITEAAVKKFQKENGLVDDGIVGPRTVEAINNSKPKTNTNNTGSGNQQPEVQPGVQPGVESTPQTGSQTNSQSGSTTQGSNSLNLYGNQRVESAERSASKFIKDEADIGKVFGELTQDFVTKIKNDPKQMAFYISALAYGGYTMGDIYADMYSQQQKKLGKTVPEAKFIDPTTKKADYVLTDSGKAASKAMETLLPSNSKMRTLDPKILKYGLSDLPDDFFAAYSERLPKPGTPEWKALASEIKTQYYDALTDVASAETEQQKALADEKMRQFREDVERDLGITLSDNSNNAWKQIQNLEETYNQRGIQQSGLKNEAVDEVLKSARLADSRNRNIKLTEEERTEMNNLRTYGTPAQIAALSAEQRQRLGLTPSSDILEKFSLENIKKADPTLTDAEAQAYRDSVLDENGNYRSSLYTNFYKDKLSNSEKAREHQNNKLLETNKDLEASLAREKEMSNKENLFDSPSNKENLSTTGSENKQYDPSTYTTQNQGLENSSKAAGNMGTGTTDGASTAVTGSKYNYDSWLTNGNLKQGSAKSNYVSELQSFLNENNYNAGTVDGIFGQNTASALKAYQIKAGVTPDSILGKDTLAAIKAGKK